MTGVARIGVTALEHGPYFDSVYAHCNVSAVLLVGVGGAKEELQAQLFVSALSFPPDAAT